MKKIFNITAEQQLQFPEIRMDSLPEMGMQREMFKIVREREIETQLGTVQMNCEMCKFRLAAVGDGATHGHDHGHDHGHNHGHDHGEVTSSQDHGHNHGELAHGASHGHDHGAAAHGHDHGHSHGAIDPYAQPVDYHARIWKVP